MADPNKGCKIIVYWLEQSRAQRIVWLLEELNLTYELKTYKRRKDMLAPQELRDIHPLGKSPMISIQAPNSATPKVIAESAVIVEYITKHFGPQLMPKEAEAVGEESEEWSRYRFFMHYAEGSLMAPLLIALAFMQIKGPKVPFIVRPITRIIANEVDKAFLNQEFTKQWEFLELQLSTSGGDYLCGPNLTGADIMMIYPLQGAIEGKLLDKAKYPKLAAYVERLEGQEKWKKAISVVEEKTGEKFSIAPGMA